MKRFKRSATKTDPYTESVMALNVSTDFVLLSPFAYHAAPCDKEVIAHIIVCALDPIRPYEPPSGMPIPDDLDIIMGWKI
jgi:hypothetical protein